MHAPVFSLACFLKLIRKSPIFGLFRLVIFRFCRMYVLIAAGTCLRIGCSVATMNLLCSPLFRRGEKVLGILVS